MAGRASCGGAPSTPSRSSAAFCSTSCPKDSPRSATTACSVRRVATCSPRRASTSSPRRLSRQPIGRRSPPCPRPRRSAHRAGAARRAGSGCCTSSRLFVRVVALHDHATARSTALRGGAASPCGGTGRRLSRARPSRSPPAPTRLSRTGSTIAITALSLSRPFDTSSSDPRTALNLQACRQRRDRVQHRSLPRLRAAKSLNSLGSRIARRKGVH